MSKQTGDKKKKGGVGLGTGLALGALVLGTGLAGVAVAGAVAYNQSKTAKKEKALDAPSSSDKEESKEAQPEKSDVVGDVEIEAFTCPITCEMIKEPATTVYGHLFEHGAILDWVERMGKCPVTNQPLTKEQIFKQYNVKGAIDEMTKMQQKLDEQQKQIENLSASQQNNAPLANPDAAGQDQTSAHMPPNSKNLMNDF